MNNLRTDYDHVRFAEVNRHDGMRAWNAYTSELPRHVGLIGEVRWHPFWGKAYFFPEKYHGLGDNVLHEICEFMAQIQQVLREEMES